MSRKVRVRFAPSPTGYLHLGGARTAIFNWLFARHMGGDYLLRVEDTDLERSTLHFLQAQVDAMNWLELKPDEEAIFQTKRFAEYKQVVDQLLAQGKAYPCFCEPVAHDQKTDFGKYQGTCRELTWTQEDLARPHAIRFRLPSHTGDITFNDLIRGPITVGMDQIDDFVIVRRDGVPVYNFVVVVDDIFMRITHIIRGEDHIPNTPKQILIYRALGAPEPFFAHLPLILGASGAPLSKRDGATSIDEYRNEGFLPEALFNYLVRLGWSHGDQEVFSKEEMVQAFAIENVQKKAAIFDKKKLLWLNSKYLREASSGHLLGLLRQVGEGEFAKDLEGVWQAADLSVLIDVYKDRAKTLLELAQPMLAFANDTPHLEVGLLAKWHTPRTGKLLEAYCTQLETIVSWTQETLLAHAQELCVAHEAPLVELAQTLRLALAGTVVTPDIFAMMAVLGVTRSSARIRRLIPLL